MNFLIVKQIEKRKESSRLWLKIGLVLNLSLIVVFKYLDFILDNIKWLGGVFSNEFKELPLTKIILPLGISFFTFQQMSLLWDVYRDKSISKVTFPNVALYVSLFPQLIAGPIVRYNDILAQINERKESLVLFKSGIKRFIIGLFKKVLIANTCGELADVIFSSEFNSLGIDAAWLGAFAYSLQIYFDFSGYSDMAIGLGRMFGFKIFENFNLPYISKSIQEFWRRWHISLSTWFKDYVYIPLGGNRLGASRTYINLLIVFVLTGFWHGANWGFLAWGLFHGIFLVAERAGFGLILKKIPAVLSWLYTMFVVVIGWVLFKLEDLNDALAFFKRLFNFGASHELSSISLYLNSERILIIILAIIWSSPLFRILKKVLDKTSVSSHFIYKLLGDSILLIMLILSVVYINSGSYNPFIYFRF